ncbi:hypothetical protein FBULB1_3938 [Fusarium bulbicola]|nr:hypothetical protein FBULB1_3938 [Fusarium bulbicola]
MDETTRLELKSLISGTGSRVSGNASTLHSAGTGESLRQSSPSWSRRVGLAVLLLLVPIAYSVILALMAYLHGKKQSSFGNTVLEVLSVASTLWPILFAAVLGPLLKTMALFRAERGSTLGSLEFLLTSQTTASALKNILTMGWIGSWAIGVIAIWSPSPLGGQAALRSLGLQQNPISTKTPATYYLGNNRSQIYPYYRDGASVFFGASAGTSLISDMRIILSTSFSTQDILVSHANTSSPHYNDTIADLGGKWEASRSGRRDLWRNVRIPFLELLPGYDGDDPHACVSVPEDEIVPYASLIGLPIRGGSFERPGNSSMTAHFHYQTLSCGNAFNRNLARATVHGLLMICAVANIIVRQRIKAPDFLDSVADVPQEGSGKSGSDRLETIKNVKVRISDVNPDEEVGKIALTTELNGPKLRWERVYA